MTWSGQGVWLSIRLSSTLQLYHTETFECLQDLDIQPCVEKMSSSLIFFLFQIKTTHFSFYYLAMEKTGLYFVHISALTTACRRLWIGTGSGIIISIPLIDGESSTYIPLCNINNAQLSVHGYCDAVKFFVPVPGQPSDDNAKTIQAKQSDSSFGDILVVSGGDGYMDFRSRNSTSIESNDEVIESIRHVSYLVVWHLGSNGN